MQYALLTRPYEESKSFAIKLKELGVESIIEPLLSIELITDENIITDLKCNESQTIIFTSKNAVNGLMNLKLSGSLLAKQVLAIGSKTAAIARAAGFKNIINIDANGEKMIEYILSNFSPKQGNIIYVSGDIVAIDLENILRQNGFTVTRLIVYRSIAVNKFSKETENLLKENKISFVIFFSQRTARIFSDLVKLSSLQDTVKTVKAFVLSKNIALSLAELKWQEIFTANAPNENSMIDIIKGCYGR